jgi:nucleoside-diphosphate-sugar epimerase
MDGATDSTGRTDTGVLTEVGAVNPWGIDRLLVLGGGYTGQRLATALAAAGVPTLLTRRGEPDPGAMPKQTPTTPLGWLRFDGASGACPAPAQLEGVSHVLVTIPPDSEGNDPVLPHLGDTLAALRPAWVGYLSTTGVYGDSGGAWVEENTPPNPAPGRSAARLACERAWRASGLPLQVFRLPAIYGPRRTPFASLRRREARLIHKPGQVFSRVHVDDIIGAVLHCLRLAPPQRPDTLILADERPCPSSETLGYAAHLLGLPLPELQRWHEVAESLSPMARSFWRENRRANSRLLRQGLGYRLLHPSYREGYRACLAEEEGGIRAPLRTESAADGSPGDPAGTGA